MQINGTTSSSAVAERPRDAVYLSVVSFDSTIYCVQSFIISHFGFRLTSASNSVTRNYCRRAREVTLSSMDTSIAIS